MNAIVPSSNVVFVFSKLNRPVLFTEPGARIVFETLDCFSEQICKPGDGLDSLDWDRVNPATGPIFVNGAMPGDSLAIHIVSIELRGQGVLACGEGFGVLGSSLKGNHVKLVPIQHQRVNLGHDLSVPVAPMIGVIGVAPAEGEVNTGTPGSHGGNMDNRMITTGATLYLPVFTEGALLAMGDLHAAMGDGEVGVSGVEVSGTVTVTVDLQKGLKLTNPVLIDAEHVSTIASAQNLEEAVNQAVTDMADLLRQGLALIGLSSPCFLV